MISGQATLRDKDAVRIVTPGATGGGAGGQGGPGSQRPAGAPGQGAPSGAGGQGAPGELPAKAHRVASDPPVERVPAAKELPQRMGLEAVSVQAADRVGHPLTLQGASNALRAERAQPDRVLLPPMVREVASDLLVDQALVARVVSVHPALQARVLQLRSRPPRPPNLPKCVADATPACVRHRAFGGCRCSRHRSFM